MGTVSAGDNLRLNSFVGHSFAWRGGTVRKFCEYTRSRGGAGGRASFIYRVVILALTGFSRFRVARPRVGCR